MKRIAIYFFIFLFTIVLTVTIGGVAVIKAEKIKLTLASALPPKSTVELGCQEFKRIIEAKTSGRIEITHYGASSLYHHKELISAVSKNMVNMGILHPGIAGRRSPVLEFVGSFGAQGCWESFDHYYRFVDDPEVLKIAASEFDKYFNCRLLASCAFASGLVGAKKPIKKVDDYKGLKMRTSGTAQATVYRALGAIPTELSSKEVYTALQRGTIDGVTAGTSRFRRSKYYEVAPYITVDVTAPYVSFWLVINEDAWKTLSPDDQKLFEETGRYIEKWTRENAAKERVKDIAFLKTKAKEFIDFSDAERTKLLNTVRPTMKEFSKKRLGAMYDRLWELLESTK